MIRVNWVELVLAHGLLVDYHVAHVVAHMLAWLQLLVSMMILVWAVLVAQPCGLSVRVQSLVLSTRVARLCPDHVWWIVHASLELTDWWVSTREATHLVVQLRGLSALIESIQRSIRSRRTSDNLSSHTINAFFHACCLSGTLDAQLLLICLLIRIVTIRPVIARRLVLLVHRRLREASLTTRFDSCLATSRIGRIWDYHHATTLGTSTSLVVLLTVQFLILIDHSCWADLWRSSLVRRLLTSISRVNLTGGHCHVIDWLCVALIFAQAFTYIRILPLASLSKSRFLRDATDPLWRLLIWILSAQCRSCLLAWEDLIVESSYLITCTLKAAIVLALQALCVSGHRIWENHLWVSATVAGRCINWRCAWHSWQSSLIFRSRGSNWPLHHWIDPKFTVRGTWYVNCLSRMSRRVTVNLCIHSDVMTDAIKGRSHLILDYCLCYVWNVASWDSHRTNCVLSYRHIQILVATVRVQSWSCYSLASCGCSCKFWVHLMTVLMFFHCQVR